MPMIRAACFNCCVSPLARPIAALSIAATVSTIANGSLNASIRLVQTLSSFSSGRLFGPNSLRPILASESGKANRAIRL